MKYLITGGAGFIGSHIADFLLKNGSKVVVIDNLSGGNKKNVSPKARFYKADITSPGVSRIFKKEKPDVVFHFAAHIEARESAKDPAFDAKTNILGSLNILENCRKSGVKKIIFASSGGEVYGDAKIIPTPESYQPRPVSPYGIAKLTVEKYLEFYQKMHGIDFVALRYGNVYGPRQNPNGEAGVVAIFIDKMLKRKQPFIHGTGKQTKDYIFVDDAAAAAVSLAKKNFSGVVNIGTGKETSVMEIFNKLKNMTGSLATKKHTAFPTIGFKRGSLSVKKAGKIINFKPQYSLDEGLKKTADWFKLVYGKK